MLIKKAVVNFHADPELPVDVDLVLENGDIIPVTLPFRKPYSVKKYVNKALDSTFHKPSPDMTYEWVRG